MITPIIKIINPKNHDVISGAWAYNKKLKDYEDNNFKLWKIKTWTCSIPKKNFSINSSIRYSIYL